MKEEELKLLENEFCLGCARSCDLLHPNCERGLAGNIRGIQKER